MNCKMCGREMEREGELCPFCRQMDEEQPQGVENHRPGVIRLTVSPDEEELALRDPNEPPKPTQSAKCPTCGHTIFKCIGPKWNEPHEHNMLIVECTQCGFQGKMRWQGVARTTLTIKAPEPPPSPGSNAAKQ